MRPSPLTKNQWKSVALNTFFAFVAAFGVVLTESASFDKATVTAALIAGLVSSFKVIEKTLKEE
jgi:hypothetical protein